MSETVKRFIGILRGFFPIEQISLDLLIDQGVLFFFTAARGSDVKAPRAKMRNQKGSGITVPETENFARMPAHERKEGLEFAAIIGESYAL